MWIRPLPSSTSLRLSSIGNVEPSRRRPTDSAERLPCVVKICRLASEWVAKSPGCIGPTIIENGCPIASGSL